MDMNQESNQQIENVNVLLIGNNPIELSSILNKLNQINGVHVITEIAFDFRTVMQRLISFKPNYIVIDDNIGRTELSHTLDKFSEDDATRELPIAVLKNSNYEESYHTNLTLDFLLKNNLSADALYRTLRNSVKFRRTHRYLRSALKRGRQSLGLV